MTTTHYTADLTDPITGEHTHLTAPTPAELEHMLEQAIAHAYPQAPEPPEVHPAQESRVFLVTD